MNDVYKKKTGKCLPITITPEMKQQIKQFKESLIDIRNTPECSSDFDVATIDIILNQLDDYDRNLLLAFYSFGDASYLTLSRKLGISRTIATRKIKIIHNKIKELNNVTKTPNNKPRCHPDS